MINEQQIDDVIDECFSGDLDYEQEVIDLFEQYPQLLSYLTQESNEILIEEERDILWYIIFVIYKSTIKSGVEIRQISHKTLMEKEEANWVLFQEQKVKSFRDKISIFFENYPQEDLLAFVEDTLETDDESPITNIGREVIFISSKTFIDSILL